MKARRQSLSAGRYQPNQGADKNSYNAPSYNDEVIAVRKVSKEPVLDAGTPSFKVNAAQPRLLPDDEEQIVLKKESKVTPRVDVTIEETQSEEQAVPGVTLMMFILAKENRQFAGYELLQTVLAAGLRFGEGGLFHRYQYSNGDGSVVCSLAAATAAGIFDLQNIGAFSVRGLCLYMQSTNNLHVNAERFSVMLDTARQLSDGLDAYLLDDNRRPLTEERLSHYHHALKLDQEHIESIAV
jgi:cell division protein ZipA